MRSRSRSPRRRHSLRHDRSRKSRSRSLPGKKTFGHETDRLARNRKLDRQREPERQREDVTKRDEDERQNRIPSEDKSNVNRKGGRYQSRRSISPADNRRRSRSREDLAKKGRTGNITERSRRGNDARTSNIHKSGRLGSRRRSNERSQHRSGDRGEKSKHSKHDRNDLPKVRENTDNIVGHAHSNMEPDIPMVKRFDQTEFSINDRFSSFSVTKPLVVDETISVEIERNIDGDEDFVIPDYFDPQVVRVLRRPDEGKKPFFLREEFLPKVFEDEKEYSERRVVKVVSSGDNTFGMRREQLNSDVLSIWDDVKNFTFNREIDKMDNERGRRMELESDRSREHRGFDARDRIRFRDKDERRLDGGNVRSGIGLKDQDLRFALNRDRDDRMVRNIVRRRDNEGGVIAGRSDVRPSFGLMDDLGSRDSQTRNRNTNELPDFSRRPGKYTYDAWKDKPELIPKGASYFEHDNRDGEEVGRGRGRDFYGGGRGGVGRGSVGRGSFSGRGLGRGGAVNRSENRNAAARSDFDHWKHDKFEELVEDDKPTSTTEK